MKPVPCSELVRFVDLYLDGEFVDEERLKYEAHIATCDACRRHTERQARWRERILEATPHAPAPASLRSKILAGLDEVERGQRAEGRRRTMLAMALPAAAAAAVVIGLGMRGTKLPAASIALPVVADVVTKHSRNLPIEVKTPKEDELRHWYADKVSFPVRPPVFKNVQASLRGGRLANVRDRDAAYLVYDVDGNKVSVFVFDPSAMPFEGAPHEHVGNRDVTMAQERGYNVALFEDDGVGYAIASDMDRASMLKLVSAVAH